MTKAELVERVARNMAMTQKATQQAVEAVFTEIAEAMRKGERFQLTGFGTFEVKKRAARVGKNPRTGEVVEIPARRVLTFHASKSLLK